MRKRWSAAPLDPDEPLEWRNVFGSRSRQLLRNLKHTEAVHGFVAALARQARERGWEVVQLDPPQRASRYFRHNDTLHSVQPDAFGVLRRGTRTWPFFLEWERPAVRPVTMAARLAPYLRYFSSERPLEDHGARPSLLQAWHGHHFVDVHALLDTLRHPRLTTLGSDGVSLHHRDPEAVASEEVVHALRDGRSRYRCREARVLRTGRGLS